MKKIIVLGQTFGIDIDDSKIVPLHECNNDQCKLLTRQLFDGLCFNCSYEYKLGKNNE